MPQEGCFPWFPPLPHTHQNAGQGGTLDPASLALVKNTDPNFVGEWIFDDQVNPVTLRQNDGDLRLDWYSCSDLQQDNPTIKHHRGRGTMAGRVIVQQDDPCGEWTSYGFDGVTWIRNARIYMDVDGVPDVDDMPGRIDFECTPAGGITPLVGMSLRNDLELVLSGSTLTWDVAGNTTIRNAANRDFIFEPGDDFIIHFNDKLGSESFYIEDVDSLKLFHVGSLGNVGIGTQSFGANASGVLAMKTKVSPTTSLADMFQMYSKDAEAVAGQACPHIRTEDDTIVILDGKIRANAPTELTISGGVITVTGSYHLVDTEGEAPADDLVTINGGVDGQLLILRAVDSARDVTVKSTGNILPRVADRVMGLNSYTTVLLYDVILGKWLELGEWP